MHPLLPYNFLRNAVGPTLLAASLACLILPGCKGNTSAAAIPDRIILAPPRVNVMHAPPNTDGDHDLRVADILSSSAWNEVHWMSLDPPANTTRTTPPTRAAVLFDESTLYVAFICEKQPGERFSGDAVSLYLDTSAAGDGTEMLKVTIDHRPTNPAKTQAPKAGAKAAPASAAAGNGGATCTWIRASTPASRKEDGSPNFDRPISTIPGFPVAGLWSAVGQGTANGAPVWTATLALPLRSLPLPLRVLGAAGAHWKFNLMRNVSSDGEQLQANLSPVYGGAQEFATDRLAEMVLGR